MVMVNLLTVTTGAEAFTTVAFSVQVAEALLIQSPALTATAVILTVVELPGSRRSMISSPGNAAVKPSGSTSVTFTLVALDLPLLVTVIVNSTSSPMTTTVSFTTLVISKHTNGFTVTLVLLLVSVLF